MAVSLARLEHYHFDWRGTGRRRRSVCLDFVFGVHGVRVPLHLKANGLSMRMCMCVRAECHTVAQQQMQGNTRT